MASYVTEYVEELHKVGRDRYARELAHSVLVLKGVTGTLRESKRPGTVITDINENLILSRLVGRVFPLVKNRNSPPGPILIGRSAENDVAIPDYSISNRHCFFADGGQKVHLGDSGSTNGTFVEGKPLAPKQIYPLLGGETLVIGRFAFLFLRPNGFLDYLLRQQ